MSSSIHSLVLYLLYTLFHVVTGNSLKLSLSLLVASELFSFKLLANAMTAQLSVSTKFYKSKLFGVPDLLSRDSLGAPPLPELASPERGFSIVAVLFGGGVGGTIGNPLTKAWRAFFDLNRILRLRRIDRINQYYDCDCISHVNAHISRRGLGSNITYIQPPIPSLLRRRKALIKTFLFSANERTLWEKHPFILSSKRSQRAKRVLECNFLQLVFAINNMPIKWVLHWQPNAGTTVNTQILTEVSQCVESINGVKEGRWKATLSFYKPMLRGISLHN
nr:uncharacterized protein LOC104110479 [Nicotiana tomentosiformis]